MGTTPSMEAFNAELERIKEEYAGKCCGEEDGFVSERMLTKMAVDAGGLFELMLDVVAKEGKERKGMAPEQLSQMYREGFSYFAGTDWQQPTEKAQQWFEEKLGAEEEFSCSFDQLGGLAHGMLKDLSPDM